MLDIVFNRCAAQDRDGLSFVLSYEARVRLHHVDDVMAKITANRLMADYGPALPTPQVAADCPRVRRLGGRSRVAVEWLWAPKDRNGGGYTAAAVVNALSSWLIHKEQPFSILGLPPGSP